MPRRTLSEVIHEYAVKHHQQYEEAKARRQEWLDAVRRLMAQLRQWLEEADKDGVLRIDEVSYQFAEPPLGWYDAPGLTCTLGTQQVKIRPSGRQTLGQLEVGDEWVRPQGRVDLSDSGYTYLLFRLLEPAGERWIMTDEGNHYTVPLTREHFEAALVRMLG